MKGKDRITFKRDKLYLIPGVLILATATVFENQFFTLIFLISLLLDVKSDILTKIVIEDNVVHGNDGWGKHSYPIEEIENISLFGVFIKKTAVKLQNGTLYIYQGIEDPNDLLKIIATKKVLNEN